MTGSINICLLLAGISVVAMLQGATPVRLIYPNGLALDDKGDLYISDIGSHAVLKLDRQGGLR